MTGNGLIGSLKRGVVGIIGRERANRLTAPFYDWQARRRTRQFLANLPAGELLVNLGCGYRPMPGWINLDHARGPEVQVVWDVTRDLPFPDSSCAAIFSEHLIEHIPKDDAQHLLEECHRVLKPGGVLRISTPDAEKFLRAYVSDRAFFCDPSFPQELETPMDRINQMMREDGQHLWTYDAESLRLLLERIGFSDVRTQQFGESLHPRMRAIDSAERAFESMYIEAVR